MLYCITAVAVEKTDRGGEASGGQIVHLVPTFVLDDQVQGIIDVGHAEQIAKDVVNPTSDPNIKVNCDVTAVTS